MVFVYFNQISNSYSKSWAVPMALMPTTWVMPSALSTWTPLWLWSKSWVAPSNVSWRWSSSTNSFPSTLKSRRKRNKVATKISLSAWNCTTSKKMALCSWLNCNTPSSPWVSSNWKKNICQIPNETTICRWKLGRWASWGPLRRLYGPWGWWRHDPLFP